MTWASGIQLHGGWAVVLAVVLTLAAFPSHAITLSYGYDANGNRITGDGKYFEYNDANRLVRIRQGNTSGPILAEFFYDHTGQRIKKIENGVRTYYIGKHFEAKQSGSGTVNTNYYFAGTERVAKTDTISGSSTLFFYHANHLGSTEAISDANGNLVNRTNYFPFGEIIQGGAEKYSFTGKERDAASGQYYFEARYYHPGLKSFNQPDTFQTNLYDPQELNRFAYVRNNPLRFVDPSGNSFIDSTFNSLSNTKLGNYLGDKLLDWIGTSPENASNETKAAYYGKLAEGLDHTYEVTKNATGTSVDFFVSAYKGDLAGASLAGVNFFALFAQETKFISENQANFLFDITNILGLAGTARDINKMGKSFHFSRADYKQLQKLIGKNNYSQLLKMINDVKIHDTILIANTIKTWLSLIFRRHFGFHQAAMASPTSFSTRSLSFSI